MKIPVPVCSVCKVKMVGAYRIRTGTSFFNGDRVAVSIRLEKSGSAPLSPRAFVCPQCSRIEMFAFPLTSSAPDYLDLYEK